MNSRKKTYTVTASKSTQGDFRRKRAVSFFAGFLAAFGVAIILGIVGFGLKMIFSQEIQTEELIPVEVTEIHKTNIIDIRMYSGDIRGVSQADVYLPPALGYGGGGTVASILVKEGQRVQRGQLIATINRQQAGYSIAAISAPVSGIVGSIDVDPGTTVSAQSRICTIADYSKVEVELNVIERDIPYIRKGLRAAVQVAAYPDVEFEGTVVRADTFVNPLTRTISAVVRLDNPGRLLKPGMFADVRVFAREVENVFAVPLRSIKESTKSQFVFIISNGRSYIREIKTGIISGKMVEVISGLNKGNILVTEGVINLRNNSKVNIITKEYKQLSSIAEIRNSNSFSEKMMRKKINGLDKKISAMKIKTKKMEEQKELFTHKLQSITAAADTETNNTKADNKSLKNEERTNKINSPRFTIKQLLRGKSNTAESTTNERSQTNVLITNTAAISTN